MGPPIMWKRDAFDGLSARFVGGDLVIYLTRYDFAGESLLIVEGRRGDDWLTERHAWMPTDEVNEQAEKWMELVVWEAETA